MTPSEKLEQAQHDQHFQRKVAEDAAFRKRMLALQKQSLRKGPDILRMLRLGKRNHIRRSACATRGQGSWKASGKTPPFILKVHRFGGIVGDAYSERQNGSEFLLSNMLGHTAKERGIEFAIDAARHPTSNPKNLFVHFSLSRPRNQPLGVDSWKNAVKLFIDQIGAKGCNFVATRHTKTDNDHVHILLSRVSPDSNKLLCMSQSFWRWRAALRQVESVLGITAENNLIQTELNSTPTSDRMVNAQRRARRLDVADSFIDPMLIEQALSKACTLKQLFDELAVSGIHGGVAVKNGRNCGVLFQKKGTDQSLAGSSIDRRFSLPRIQIQLETNRLAFLQREQDQLLSRQKHDLRQQVKVQPLNCSRER